MKIGTALILGLLPFLCTPLWADPAGCDFTPRKALQAFLGALPSQVVGVVSCSKDFPQTNDLVVGRLTKLNEKTLSDFVLKYASKVEADGKSSKVIWQSPDARQNLQVLVRTERSSHAEPGLHYAFAVPVKEGGALVFIHSAGENQTHQLRPALDTIRARLSDPAFAESVVKSK